MSFESLLNELKTKSKYAELYDHIINYLIEFKIDSLQKLRETLKDKITFCTSFAGTIIYQSDEYKEDNKRAALEAYNYLKGFIDKSDEKPPFAYRHKETLKLYDYDYYDIAGSPKIMAILANTDDVNTGICLLLNLPTIEFGPEFQKFKHMKIAEIKQLIKNAASEGKELKWLLGLGDDCIKKLIDAINYYNQRMLENALEAARENCYPENLTLWRLEEKKAIVRRSLSSIVSAIIDNPTNPNYIFGSISSNYKRKIWNLVKEGQQNDEKLERLVTILAQAFTYNELQQGVFLEESPQINISKSRVRVYPVYSAFTIR